MHHQHRVARCLFGIERRGEPNPDRARVREDLGRKGQNVKASDHRMRTRRCGGLEQEHSSRSVSADYQMVMDRVPNTAEVLAALSRALDLVEGQPAGHAVRTAFVALRIAEELGLSEVDREDLLYAALLKDSGCSSNAVRIHGLFGGDEFVAKHAVKFTKWCSPVANAIYGLQHIGRGERFLARFQRLLRAIPQTSGKANFMAEVTAARCTRGAEIARQLGFRSPVGRAIHDLDEHWDGKGASQGLVGPATPLIARILCCAQTLEVFAYERGTEVAFRMLRARKGKWFDPAVVNAALVLRQDAHFWETNRTRDAHAVSQLPLLAGEVPDADADLDAICAAFAMIVDAKSSFTAEHSTRVTGYALGLADDLGLSASDPPPRRPPPRCRKAGRLLGDP
ncbi:MAG: hypothetical protein C4320_09375 [Armatimonadota bacterium]